MIADVPDDHPLLVQFRQDPYPLYRHLLEHGPVQWNEVLHAWTLARYVDVASVLGDARFSADRTPDGAQRELPTRTVDAGLRPTRPHAAACSRAKGVHPADHRTTAAARRDDRRRAARPNRPARCTFRSDRRLRLPVARRRHRRAARRT